MAVLQVELLILPNGALPRLHGCTGTNSGEILTVAIAESDVAAAEYERVQRVIVYFLRQLAGVPQHLAVGSADGVPAFVKLDHDKRVAAPWNFLVAADLAVHEVAVGTPADVAETDLRVDGELNGEKVGYVGTRFKRT